MKYISSQICLAILACVAVVIAHGVLPSLVTAAIPGSGELFYMYFQDQIPLELRDDAIAVSPKLPRNPTDTPFYLQIREDLQEGNHRCSDLELNVKPVRGKDFALVSLVFPTLSRLERLRQCLDARKDVAEIFPILKRRNRDELILLPNEIIISFKPGLSQEDIRFFLAVYNLKMIRKLRLDGDCYLVALNFSLDTANLVDLTKSDSHNSGFTYKSNYSFSGNFRYLRILDIANQINQASQIEYGVPNLITLPYRYISLQGNKKKYRKSTNKLNNTLPEDGETGKRVNEHNFITQLFTKTDNERKSAIASTALRPWQWYLNSSPLITCLSKPAIFEDCLKQTVSPEPSSPIRTDIRALEAWREGGKGDGVVVAVIDSLIQWNHPDLQGNIYTTNNPQPNLYPGETHGWDFIEEDAETLISEAEKHELQQRLKHTSPWNSESILINAFHGTLVTGIIAAHSANPDGLMGVAPNATILPVRAADLEGVLDLVDEAEAIAFSGSRGADIINMSFGGDPPHPLVKTAIAQAMANNPHLVFVASAGNDYSTEESYPAAYQDVVTVGATTIAGNRAWYSNYGYWLDV
ncbi:MAG TPA: hypothetical protein DD000_25545, partial [Cyanobacteria bacterium UBA11166]|nr:hypothetical protein [Cyanobacteria bacterium UBA11166]